MKITSDILCKPYVDSIVELKNAVNKLQGYINDHPNNKDSEELSKKIETVKERISKLETLIEDFKEQHKND